MNDGDVVLVIGLTLGVLSILILPLISFILRQVEKWHNNLKKEN